MLAMRDGQPCLVHGVGGIKDTVSNFESGFVFNGNTINEQITNLTDLFNQSLELLQQNPQKYSEISANAKSSRFTWSSIAKQYIDKLYN
jgi:starch synthase